MEFLHSEKCFGYFLTLQIEELKYITVSMHLTQGQGLFLPLDGVVAGGIALSVNKDGLLVVSECQLFAAFHLGYQRLLAPSCCKQFFLFPGELKENTSTFNVLDIPLNLYTKYISKF